MLSNKKQKEEIILTPEMEEELSMVKRRVKNNGTFKISSKFYACSFK